MRTGSDRHASWDCKCLIGDIAGVPDLSCFEDQDFRFLIGRGAVLDTAPRNDDKLSWAHITNPVTKLHSETAFPDQEHFPAILMLMPWKDALNLDHFHLPPVEVCDHLRASMFREKRKLRANISMLYHLLRSPRNPLRQRVIYGLNIASASLALAGCTTDRSPQFSYDNHVPPLAEPPAVEFDSTPEPLHKPPSWTPAKGGAAAKAPTARVSNANAAARVEPRREGYYNAIQIYPWSEGALYQVYATPGKITDIALEPGEKLTGAGPIAAGDTTRWIIGDTTSGSGAGTRTHVLVKPTRPDISTNLVISTDRRSYMIELRASEETWMPAVSWDYPRSRVTQRVMPAQPSIPAAPARDYRYGLQIPGDSPPWRPVSVFDDGRHVYVVFPPGIVQGEMPPIFVLGPDGEPQIVNSRVHQNVLIVDRLFATAELRLGSGDRQQVVGIVRIEPTQARAAETSKARKGATSS